MSTVLQHQLLEVEESFLVSRLGKERVRVGKEII